MTKQVPIDVSVTKHGEVALLKMSGTENRINTTFCKKWNEALDKVESWSDVRALVSTGTGKFYSNGLDLDFLKSCSRQEIDEYATAFQKLRLRLVCFPMVTIAAINGHCFAGGVIFALLHDYRVMHNGKGWICLNEVDLNIKFNDFTVAIFRQKLNPRINRDAVIFGNRFTAKQALDIGIIDDIAPNAEVVSKAIELANIKTKGRRYNRKILADMKKDLYGEILNSDDTRAGVPKLAHGSKL